MSGWRNQIIRGCVAGMILAALGAAAWGQSASMYGDPAQRPPLTVDRASWTYQPAQPPKVYKIHDLITVLVDEKAQVTTEGQMDRQKKADESMVLKKWILLDNLSLKPAPMTDGEPAVAGQLDSKYRANGDLETREAMKLEITCEVVDIRPNGLLVLEGHESIQFNEEQWDMSLQGAVRPEDVLPDNTVQSKKVFGLRIDKREKGHVRDAYRRGWLLRVMDRLHPF